MNKALKGLGLVLLSTLLVAGCGGTEPEPMDIPQSEGPQQSLAEPEPVTAETACCYVLCSDQVWRGPYKNVTYGNCRNYGKYVCANRNLGFVNAEWKDC